MIVVLSAHDDATVPAVLSKLRERGADVLWFDPKQFPGRSQVSLELDGRGFFRKVLHVEGRDVDLAEVTAVWLRRPNAVEAGPAVREEGRRHWAQETARHALDGVYELLDCLWVPALPRVSHAAGNKVRQLQAAAELGFRLPRTCITNSPDTFLDFREATEGNLVSKLVGAVLLWNVDGAPPVSFTAPVRRRHAIHAQTVRHGPTIFQAYVEKRLELRVTVVGEQVLAVAIDSQSSRLTRHDWRHYDDERTAYTPHELPPDVRENCLRLLRRFGLTFGTIDLVLTPEGDYVFLELNPNGQWSWVEGLSGAPIAQAIADLLLAGRAGRTEEAPDAHVV